MKKILVALMLCIVSIIGMGQTSSYYELNNRYTNEYGRLVENIIDTLKNRDTVLLGWDDGDTVHILCENQFEKPTLTTKINGGVFNFDDKYAFNVIYKQHCHYLLERNNVYLIGVNSEQNPFIFSPDSTGNSLNLTTHNYIIQHYYDENNKIVRTYYICFKNDLDAFVITDSRAKIKEIKLYVKQNEVVQPDDNTTSLNLISKYQKILRDNNILIQTSSGQYDVLGRKIK